VKRECLIIVLLVSLLSLVSLADWQMAEWPVDTTGDGLISYWKLDDVSVQDSRVAHYKMNDNAASSTVTNEEGTNGTLEDGSDDYTSDHDVDGVTTAGFVRALEFDGSDDYVDTGQTFQSTFRGSFTLSVFVALDDGQDSDTQMILCSFDPDQTGDNMVELFVSVAGDVGAYYYADDNGGLALTDEVVFDNGATGWTHLAAVFRDENESAGAKTITLYVNGEAVDLDASYDGDLDSATDFDDFTTTDNLYMAAYWDDGFTTSLLDGRMDNVEVYGYALEAEEVKALYDLQDEDTETADSTAIDYCNRHDGTTSDPVDELYDLSGQVGSCFDLDGSDDYITVSDHADLDFDSDESFSFAAWFKTSYSSAYQCIGDKTLYDSGYDDGWRLYLTSGGAIYGVTWANSSQESVGDTTAWNDGSWHHAVFVRDADEDELRLYMDGRLEDTESVSSGRDLSTSVDMKLGVNCSGNTKFDGKLDNVMLYARALSTSDANDLYCRGADAKASDGVTWQHWEDLRYAYWLSYINPTPHRLRFTPPSIVEFGPDGEYADTWGPGEIFCSDPNNDDEIYFNKTQRTATQCGGNPSGDSTNWAVAADPSFYHHFDRNQERYMVTSGGTARQAYTLLPVQVDPRYQVDLSSQVGGFVSTPTSKSISASEWQDWYDMIETLVTSSASELCGEVTSTFTSRWEDAEDDTYDLYDDGGVQLLTSHYWGCNGNEMEWMLERAGSGNYDWILDTTTPYIPAGWNNDPNSSGGTGEIVATWRRIPSCYPVPTFDGTVESSTDTLVWPGDCGTDPPGYGYDNYIGNDIDSGYTSHSLSWVRSEVEDAWIGSETEIITDELVDDLLTDHGWMPVTGDPQVWPMPDVSLITPPSEVVNNLRDILDESGELRRRLSAQCYEIKNRVRNVVIPDGDTGHYFSSINDAISDWVDAINDTWADDCNPNNDGYGTKWEVYTSAPSWYPATCAWYCDQETDPNKYTLFVDAPTQTPGPQVQAWAVWPKTSPNACAWMDMIGEAWECPPEYNIWGQGYRVEYLGKDYMSASVSANRPGRFVSPYNVRVNAYPGKELVDGFDAPSLVTPAVQTYQFITPNPYEWGSFGYWHDVYLWYGSKKNDRPWSLWIAGGYGWCELGASSNQAEHYLPSDVAEYGYLAYFSPFEIPDADNQAPDIEFPQVDQESIDAGSSGAIAAPFNIVNEELQDEQWEFAFSEVLYESE